MFRERSVPGGSSEHKHPGRVEGFRALFALEYARLRLVKVLFHGGTVLATKCWLFGGLFALIFASTYLTGRRWEAMATQGQRGEPNHGGD